MGLTLADSYYLKAKAATGGYCSDWEEACEALNYALSYDEEHCASLCLLGDIYAKYLHAPEQAFECFDKVIAIDQYYVEVYYKYIKYLIWDNKLKRAKKLVTFASTLDTISKAEMHWLSSYIEEVSCNYKRCLKHLKIAKSYCYNDYYFDFMIDEEKRIEKKIKLNKKKASGKKNKKKKKAKTKKK